MRRSALGRLVERFFGGQAARAGFSFVWRMMLRDWQFRRQLAPMLLPVLLGLGGLATGGLRADPFSGRFTAVHVLPHAPGMLLFFVCGILAYGSDYKGAWIFLLAPSRALDGFARGVHALLWIGVVVIPQLILAPVLAWFWGPVHAGLFAVYGVAAGSVYLALEIRLIEGLPFGRPMDPSRGPASLILAMLGGFAAAIAVGLQYFLLFRSPALVAAASAALGCGAYFLTRRSVDALASRMRFSLGLVSGEAVPFYKEVGV